MSCEERAAKHCEMELSATRYEERCEEGRAGMVADHMSTMKSTARHEPAAIQVITWQAD